jgi:hypothetical protein
MSRPIDVVLGRLEGVRKAGKGWRADSPCGNRSRGALSIAESDAGGVLLCDFSGYSAAEVCDAIGLKVSDLYPERAKEQSPADRRENRRALALASVQSAAEVIGRESRVVLAAVGSLLKGEALPLAEVERLRLAGERIDAVRDALSCEVRS